MAVQTFPNHYSFVDLSTGNVVYIWGDSTGGIYFRIGKGRKHCLDEDVKLQGIVMEAILKYYINLKRT